jgi:hypothetical protein
MVRKEGIVTRKFIAGRTSLVWPEFCQEMAKKLPPLPSFMIASQKSTRTYGKKCSDVKEVS